MYKSESIVKNKYKILKDLEIQTDHLISARRPDRVILNKNNKRKENLPNSSGGARGVVVIAVGNEHGDTSSNPGRD